MAPLMNEPDDDHSARSHYELCCQETSLRSWEYPLVGCASHQLNRAMQQYLIQHEDDLAAVQALMIKLRTLTQSANFVLKLSCDL
ncbi:hypothetical protein F442_23078 [Phytophthora nicotianae P10297]|uniref:Uncharacterized protein n=1 Tax=Phytophthora nicotianae P10297 TaxID=1317064 RepID=W2XXR9_PHYNI|nr:hypothetical protein F442_23078 [Phytophthora nicotianae P10297]